MFIRPLRRRSGAPPPPALVGVMGGNVQIPECGGGGVSWIAGVSWGVTNPDNALYKIRVRWSDSLPATPPGSVIWNTLATGLDCAAGSSQQDTLVAGTVNLMGGSVEYRRFRVEIQQRSDDAVIASEDTTVGEMRYDPC